MSVDPSHFSTSGPCFRGTLYKLIYADCGASDLDRRMTSRSIRNTRIEALTIVELVTTYSVDMRGFD